MILGVCDGFHHTGPGYLLLDPDGGVCLYVHQRRQPGRTFSSQENTTTHAKAGEGWLWIYLSLVLDRGAPSL